MKGHKVDESRDELLCQVAVLSRGVSAMIHDALGSPSSPSRRDLDFQIVTLGVRCVNQLQVEEYSEAARAVLICCFLRQVRATFGRYDELADAFTLDSFLEITESARDMFSTPLVVATSLTQSVTASSRMVASFALRSKCLMVSSGYSISNK